MNISTPDLYDAHGDSLQVAEPGFRHFGGVQNFYGEIATIKCFEDNSRVAEAVRTPGNGRVLVVDGGGSMRRALLGDNLARLAIDNHWRGIIVYGCIRDVEEIADMAIGVMALASIPAKTEKLGEGHFGVPLAFAGLRCQPGDYLYADGTGIVVSAEPLTADGAGA